MVNVSQAHENEGIRLGGVKFAPLSIPRYRRLQTAAVVTWVTLPALIPAIFLVCCSFPPLWPLVIMYILWAMVFDTAAENGGRPSRWIRNSPIFKFFAGYFPVSLIKTVELPSDRRYVFGYHPHGIIGMGAIANFGTDATGFSKLFPGLKPHLLTLSSNFKIPLYRDVLLSLGICSVSYKSCSNILRQGPGSALTIVVGGATESLSARPGTADLILKRRLGFIRLAVTEGADLVPVFSFGENDIFAQLANDDGTTLHQLQKKFQNIFGFTLPVFHGRGIFNYSVGLMPYRHPIVSVVGNPVRVKQNKNPTKEELEKVQKQYIEELTRIWNSYKDLYATNRTQELEIVA